MKLLGATLFFGACYLLPLVRGQTPALSVELVPGSQIQLSWSNAAGELVLERTAQLAPVTMWQVVTTTPVLTGGRLQVELPAGAAAEFFRLRGAPAPALTTVVRVTPGAGESGVSVQRETIVEFSEPLLVAPTDGKMAPNCLAETAQSKKPA